MNLSQLPYIVTIAETGNLSAASRILGVSQPGLSKYLAKLEQEVGMALFTVDKRRYRPTQAGSLYIAAARRILSIQQQTLSTIHALNSQAMEKLRVGMTPHQGAQVLAELFPLLNQRFPHVVIEPYEGYTQTLYAAVLEKKVDLAMTTVIDDPPRVDVLPMCEEEIVLSVPAFYAQARLSSSDAEQMGVIDLREFADAPFVLMKENTSIGGIAARALAQAGIRPTVVFCSENGYIVDQMIRSGSGVGFAPRHYATPSESVVYFHLRQPLYYSACVVTRRGYALSSAQRYLIYLLHRHNAQSGIVRTRQEPALTALCQEFDALYSTASIRGL